MTTNSQHYFGSNIRDGFSITIIEVLTNLSNEAGLYLYIMQYLFAVFDQNMKEEYGLFVWPSSVILAEYVWQQRSRFCGANVVEVSEAFTVSTTVRFFPRVLLESHLHSTARCWNFAAWIGCC